MLFDITVDERMMDVFRKVGFEEKTIEAIEDNIINKKDIEDLHRIINTAKDYDEVGYQDINLFSNILDENESKNDKDGLFYKYFYLTYTLLDDRLFKEWRLKKYFMQNCFNKCQLSGVPYTKYIRTMIVKGIEDNESVLNKGEFDKLLNRYRLGKGSYLEVLSEDEYLDVKAIIAAVVIKDGEYIKGDFDTYFSYIKGYFGFVLKNDMAKLIGVDVFKETIEFIIGDRDVMPKEYNCGNKDISNLNLLTSIAYLLKDNSVCKRLLQIMFKLNSNMFFNQIAMLESSSRYHYSNLQSSFEITKENEEFIESDNEILEAFITWLAYGELDKNNRSKLISYYYGYARDIYDRAYEAGDKRVKESLGFEYILDQSNRETYLIPYEDEIEEVAVKFLEDAGLKEDMIKDFRAYINGDKPLSKVKFPKHGYPSYSTDYKIYYYIDVLVKGNSRMSRSYVNYFLRLGVANTNYMNGIIGIARGTGGDNLIALLVNICRAIEIPDLETTAFVASVQGQEHTSYKNSSYVVMEVMLGNNRMCVMKAYDIANIDGKAYILKRLRDEYKDFNFEEKMHYIDLIKRGMSESSKTVKQEVFASLSDMKEAKDIAKEGILSKKASTRDMAIDILIKYEDNETKDVLKVALSKEKSDKVREKLLKALGEDQIYEGEEAEENLESYCKDKLTKAKLAKVKWIDINCLSKIRYDDSSEEITEEIYKYLLVIYSQIKDIELSVEGKHVASKLNKDDLGNMAFDILNLWIAEGAEAKKKWVLILVATFGDSRSVQLLQKCIKKWPAESRGTMATYAVKALALNGSEEALFFIDGIRLKFKFKQVKKAAAEALEIAAKELNLNTEELSDKLIPTLGFDSEGCKVFDYGPRKFNVLLSKDLDLIVQKEGGKTLKNLPAVGKKDDIEKASKAREEYKLLKKQLKNVVTSQRDRLELALSSVRNWTVENWKNVFVNNHIMHKFAESLIWGLYVNNRLEISFRYMDDGTYNTYDEEELDIDMELAKLGEGVKISLVHPIDLDDDTKDAWKEQLEDYEISQPFPQLDRMIFTATEEDAKSLVVDRFAGYTMNGLSLIGKLQKQGWYRGSVVDAGSYDNYYKEFNSVGVQIYFRSLWVGMSAYDSEETMIYEYAFYKVGTINRGSYIYDDITKDNIINPKEVSKKIYSEVANDLYNITKGCDERDKDYKKDYQYTGPELKRCNDEE